MNASSSGQVSTPVSKPVDFGDDLGDLEKQAGLGRTVLGAWGCDCYGKALSKLGGLFS